MLYWVLYKRDYDMTQPSVTDEMAAAFVAAHCANPDSIRASIAAAIAAMPPIKLVKAAYKVPGESQTYSSYWEGVCDGIESAKESIESAGLRWVE